MPGLFLLHFEPPYRHARHYLGYAVGLGRARAYAEAIAAGHALGPHELVMAAQWHEHRIHVVAVLEEEGRATQRAMRSSHNLARYCPICLSAAEAAREELAQ